MRELVGSYHNEIASSPALTQACAAPRDDGMGDKIASSPALTRAGAAPREDGMGDKIASSPALTQSCAAPRDDGMGANGYVATQCIASLICLFFENLFCLKSVKIINFDDKEVRRLVPDTAL